MILAANHVSNADPVDRRRVAHPAPRPADPLARQEGDVRLAGRRLGGPQRRRHPGRSRRAPTSRRSGWPSGSSTPATSCWSSPRARAARPASSRTPKDGVAMLALRTARRSSRSASSNTDAVWPQGPEAAAARRPRHDADRRAVPARRRAPAGGRTGQGAKAVATDADHAAHRGAPGRTRHRGAYGDRPRRLLRPPAIGEPRPGRRGGPCDNRPVWEPSRSPDRAAHRLLLRGARGDRQGQGGLGRRQVDPYPRPGRPQRGRRPRPPAARASRPSRRSTTSTTARRS